METNYVTFRTKRKYYVYDAYINKITSISDNLYKRLTNVDENKILEDEEYKILEKIGFFKRCNIFLLNNPESNFLPFYYERKLGNIVLQVTQACNLRCKYCPYSQENNLNRYHSNKVMSVDVMKKSIDYIAKNSVDVNTVVIGFYGGEPLLNFNLIKKTVEYSKNKLKGKNIIYGITTNLTEMNEDIYDFFEDNEFQIMVSLDGAKQSNDKNRQFFYNQRSVFETVIRNLKIVDEKYPHIQQNLSINVVVDPSEDFSEYDLLFKEYSFVNKFRFYMSLKDDAFSDEKNIWNIAFRNKYFYKLFLCYLGYVNCFALENDLKLFNRIQYSMEENINCLNLFDLSENNFINDAVLPLGMCVVGKRKIFIDVNGNFFPCEKVGEMNEEFKIGNIDTGLNLKKASNLLNFNKNFKQRCVSCIAMRDCRMCLKEFAITGVHEKSDKVCEKYKADFILGLITKATLHESLTLENNYE